MATDIELGVLARLQEILDDIASEEFACVERKSGGRSEIGKPVDLEVRTTGNPSRPLVAIEVANVNTTQLVGEACRLFYDSLPLKLLVLAGPNVPKNGRPLCEKILSRLYGQSDIRFTPARVVWDHETEDIERAFRELLVR